MFEAFRVACASHFALLREWIIILLHYYNDLMLWVWLDRNGLNFLHKIPHRFSTGRLKAIDWRMRCSFVYTTLYLYIKRKERRKKKRKTQLKWLQSQLLLTDWLTCNRSECVKKVPGRHGAASIFLLIRFRLEYKRGGEIGSLGFSFD